VSRGQQRINKTKKERQSAARKWKRRYREYLSTQFPTEHTHYVDSFFGGWRLK
jgi:hypothetical protein